MTPSTEQRETQGQRGGWPAQHPTVSQGQSWGGSRGLVPRMWREAQNLPELLHLWNGSGHILFTSRWWAGSGSCVQPPVPLESHPRLWAQLSRPRSQASLALLGGLGEQLGALVCRACGGSWKAEPGWGLFSYPVRTLCGES